jgi:hypothetical protein
MVAAFLAELRGRGVEVSGDGDRLRCSAPPGVLTPELRDQLQQRKGEILAFLRARADGDTAFCIQFAPATLFLGGDGLCGKAEHEKKKRRPLSSRLHAVHYCAEAGRAHGLRARTRAWPSYS